MIPVFQRYTTAEHGFGDCFNACVASVLEIPLSDASEVRSNTKGVWYREWQKWFLKRGYALEVGSLLTPPKGYSIVTVETDRVYPEGHPKEGEHILHACVALDGKIVHDPFPEPSLVYNVRYFHHITKL